MGSFAVVGASSHREKYGNKVLRCYAQHDLPVVGVNPKLDIVEGQACYASIVDIPGEARAVSIVAPPKAAAAIVADAIRAGVRHLWFQPGAEDEQAIAYAVEQGLEVIARGACLLVVLGYRED